MSFKPKNLPWILLCAFGIYNKLAKENLTANKFNSFKLIYLEKINFCFEILCSLSLVLTTIPMKKLNTRTLIGQFKNPTTLAYV